MSYTPTFSYQGGANPIIDYPRLLISDTVQFAADGTTPVYVFSDQEITSAESIVMGIQQSAQFFNTPAGPTGGGTLGSYLPNLPVPYYRVAGMLLNSMAANKSKLSSVMQLLDVKLDSSKAAKALQDQAKAYFEMDDNSGAFVIIEQVNDSFSFASRFWKTWQRQTAT